MYKLILTDIFILELNQLKLLEIKNVLCYLYTCKGPKM